MIIHSFKNIFTTHPTPIWPSLPRACIERTICRLSLSISLIKYVRDFLSCDSTVWKSTSEERSNKLHRPDQTPGIKCIRERCGPKNKHCSIWLPFAFTSLSFYAVVAIRAWCGSCSTRRLGGREGSLSVGRRLCVVVSSSRSWSKASKQLTSSERKGCVEFEAAWRAEIWDFCLFNFEHDFLLRIACFTHVSSCVIFYFSSFFFNSCEIVYLAVCRRDEVGTQWIDHRRHILCLIVIVVIFLKRRRDVNRGGFRVSCSFSHTGSGQTRR